MGASLNVGSSICDRGGLSSSETNLPGVGIVLGNRRFTWTVFFHAGSDVCYTSRRFQSAVTYRTSVELLGLLAEFHEPTHAGHCLDRPYSTEPVYINCVAFQSTVSTAHKAIIARADQTQTSKTGKISKTCTFRSRSPAQHARLMNLLTGHFLGSGVEYSGCARRIWSLLWNFIESVWIRLYAKNNYFDKLWPKIITPQIKSLLRTRNRLMHKGKTCAANSITNRINRHIVAHNASRLSSVKEVAKNSGKPELTGKNKQADRQYPVDADTLNSHYAAISTDSQYMPPLPKLTVNKFTEFFTEQRVFQLLDTVGQTATGLDKIPSWFFRIAAPLISAPTAYVFNLSLSYSVVPTQWKSSSITPVPKVPQPKTCLDFQTNFCHPGSL